MLTSDRKFTIALLLTAVLLIFLFVPAFSSIFVKPVFPIASEDIEGEAEIVFTDGTNLTDKFFLIPANILGGNNKEVRLFRAGFSYIAKDQRTVVVSYRSVVTNLDTDTEVTSKDGVFSNMDRYTVSLEASEVERMIESQGGQLGRYKLDITFLMTGGGTTRFGTATFPAFTYNQTVIRNPDTPKIIDDGDYKPAPTAPIQGRTLDFMDGSKIIVPDPKNAVLYIDDAVTGYQIYGPGYNLEIQNTLGGLSPDMVTYVQRGHYKIFIDKYTKAIIINRGPSGFTGYLPLPPDYYSPPYG